MVTIAAVQNLLFMMRVASAYSYFGYFVIFRSLRLTVDVRMEEGLQRRETVL
jgi:hypothetical protein